MSSLSQIGIGIMKMKKIFHYFIISSIDSDNVCSYNGMHESREDNNIEEQWAGINVERKRASYIERDCFKEPQNYFSTFKSRI
jgi:hypothetical protein